MFGMPETPAVLPAVITTPRVSRSDGSAARVIRTRERAFAR